MATALSESNGSTGFMRKYAVLIVVGISILVGIGAILPSLDRSVPSLTCSQVTDTVVELYAKNTAKRAAQQFNVLNSGGVLRVPLEDQALIDTFKGLTTVDSVSTDARSGNAVRCSATAKIDWQTAIASMQSIEEKHPFQSLILGAAKMYLPSEQRITYEAKPLDDGRLYITLMPTLY